MRLLRIAAPACSADTVKAPALRCHPLSGVSGRKRYNTLDLAGKVACQGRLCPLWKPPERRQKQRWPHCHPDHLPVFISVHVRKMQKYIFSSFPKMRIAGRHCTRNCAAPSRFWTMKTVRDRPFEYQPKVRKAFCLCAINASRR